MIQPSDHNHKSIKSTTVRKYHFWHQILELALLKCTHLTKSPTSETDRCSSPLDDQRCSYEPVH